MVGNGTGNALKFVLHMQHNYFSFFNQQYSCFVALSLPASTQTWNAKMLERRNGGIFKHGTVEYSNMEWRNT